MRTKLLSLKTLLVICLMAIVGGVETWAQTTEKVDFTAKGYTDKEKVASYVGENFSVAFSKGSNTNKDSSPTYYTTGTSIRFYGGNTMTISSSSQSISKVVFTYGSKSPSSDTGYKLSSGSYSKRSNTWNSGSSAGVSSITFTNPNTSGHYRIKTIEVTFASGEEESVATPTITPASQEFDTPFVATIACTTTGATIYYTLDGTDPTSSTSSRQTYTSMGVSIPAATTTLKACASLNGKNSSVASATYTYTEQGDAPIVIWSEDWSGLSKDAKPTQGENATYVCSGSSGRGTRIFTEKLAGGESPEILVASKGFLTITINDLKGASEGLILTFKANQTKGQFAASVDNAVIVSADAEGSNKLYVHKYIMALNEGATSLTITLKNDLTSNARVDDLELSTYSGVGSFKITEAGYGTYYSSKAYTMPKGVKGYTITGNEGTSLVMNEAYAAGDVVPAKTALVVEGAANKYYTLVAASTELTPANNKLHGSDKAEMTYVDGTNVKYYKLSYNNEGNNLGFYWGSENGAAFTNGAHKAYLALDSETLLSQSRGFSLADLAHGVTTGINTTVKSATQSTFIYDLNGRRINSLNGAAKGVYIMNGQKVLVK